MGGVCGSDFYDGKCGVEKAQCWDAKRWRRRQASAGKGSENPKPARGKACGFCAVCERRKEVGALAAANVKRRRPRKVSIRASLCYDRRAGQVTR